MIRKPCPTEVRPVFSILADTWTCRTETTTTSTTNPGPIFGGHTRTTTTFGKI
jgi:hypothetical protein